MKTIYSADHKKLIEKLKKARKEAGLDQIQAAKLLGKTQSYISKVESGQRRLDLMQMKEFSRIYRKQLRHFIE